MENESNQLPEENQKAVEPSEVQPEHQPEKQHQRVNKRLIIAGVSLVLLVGVGGYAYHRYGKSSSPKEIETEQPAKTEQPEPVQKEKDSPIPTSTESVEAQIAYIEDGNVLVWDTNKQEIIQVTEDGLNSDPKWSPDGNKLAWMAMEKFEEPSERYHGVNIKIMDYQSMEIEELLEPYDLSVLQGVNMGVVNERSCLSLWNFEWSSDSEKIVYSRNGVWIKDLESGEEERLVDPYWEDNDILQNGLPQTDFEAKPNYVFSIGSVTTSEKVVIGKPAYMDGASYEILDIQSGDTKQIPDDIPIHPKLSPDSNKILAGGSYGLHKGLGGVYYYDLNKGELITISEKQSLGMLWLNDNQVVASLSVDENSGSEIFIINLDGSIEKQLTSDGREKYLAAISPDKKWAVYYEADTYSGFKTFTAVSLEDGAQTDFEEVTTKYSDFSWRPGLH